MMRARKLRSSGAVDAAVPSSSSPPDDDDDNDKASIRFSAATCCNPHSSASALALLAIACFCGGAILFGLVRVYYKIELTIQNPYLKAVLYSPLRTFFIRYLDEAPAERRSFRATANNTFVINLESDAIRRERFEKNNHRDNGSAVPYQIFPATKWVLPILDLEDGRKQDKMDIIDLQLQQEYAQRYSFVGQKSASGHYGDAASTLSHIRLMEQLVARGSSNEKDYYIIFEDDVIIREPLRSTGIIEAPADAHVIFLVGYATKLVPTGSNGEVRVMQGYGAQGYVVTRTGAKLILRHLRHHFTAADSAMAGDASGLRVYLPEGWPLVDHAPGRGGSSRRTINAKK